MATTRGGNVLPRAVLGSATSVASSSLRPAASGIASSAMAFTSQQQQQQHRAFSVSRPSLLAQPVERPVTGPTQVSPSGGSSGPHMVKNAVMGAQDEQTRLSESASTPAARFPDYSKGPSALDKAAQMFFFTEILRGEL